MPERFGISKHSAILERFVFQFRSISDKGLEVDERNPSAPTPGPLAGDATQPMPTTANEIGNMHEELEALEARYSGLQALVGELLQTNQKLRIEIARLKEKHEPSAPATHPRPHQDR